MKSGDVYISQWKNIRPETQSSHTEQWARSKTLCNKSICSLKKHRLSSSAVVISRVQPDSITCSTGKHTIHANLVLLCEQCAHANLDVEQSTWLNSPESIEVISHAIRANVPSKDLQSLKTGQRQASIPSLNTAKKRAVTMYVAPIKTPCGWGTEAGSKAVTKTKKVTENYPVEEKITLKKPHKPQIGTLQGSCKANSPLTAVLCKSPEEKKNPFTDSDQLLTGRDLCIHRQIIQANAAQNIQASTALPTHVHKKKEKGATRSAETAAHAKVPLAQEGTKPRWEPQGPQGLQEKQNKVTEPILLTHPTRI